ncbi:MAG: GAF domain-containing sensor histidine kinase [Chloroflexi bacterium]|nr:GAF domain-containing sensor histidine kinase [Chloroflexota bacterium]
MTLTQPETTLIARYERIIEISQQLNSTFDHISLLHQIIAAAMELTRTEASSILLLDAATGELRFKLSSNMDPTEMDAIVVPMEGSIAGWVVTRGEARVIEDVTKEPSHFTSVDDMIKFTTRNILAVPLRAHSKVIGVLEALNKHSGETFNDEDITTLTVLAGQAAIAIENSRLFQQSDFMAEMVHELRTPLAALKTSTNLLLRPDLPVERRDDIIVTMQGETERLITMTNDFLDLARLESGRSRLDIRQFELTKLLHECAEVVAQQAKDRGIDIEINTDDLTASGDRGKIKQVLLNLLTNGIKYNRENGKLFIRAYRSKRHEEPFAEIMVRDTGRGISKEDQQHMFQKFFRVAATANSATGTGLGLAISKHIVEAHKGTIWLESEVEVGSAFFFTLPIVNR